MVNACEISIKSAFSVMVCQLQCCMTYANMKALCVLLYQGIKCAIVYIT